MSGLKILIKLLLKISSPDISKNHFTGKNLASNKNIKKIVVNLIKRKEDKIMKIKYYVAEAKEIEVNNEALEKIRKQNVAFGGVPATVADDEVTAEEYTEAIKAIEKATGIEFYIEENVDRQHIYAVEDVESGVTLLEC